MKRIQMPSSYAVVTDGEKALLGGIYLHLLLSKNCSTP